MAKELSALPIVGGLVGIVTQDEGHGEYTDGWPRALRLVDLNEGRGCHLGHADGTLFRFLLALEVVLLGNTYCSLSFRAYSLFHKCVRIIAVFLWFCSSQVQCRALALL